MRRYRHQQRRRDPTALSADQHDHGLRPRARRIYLTGTLADDSILVTDLDADPALLVRPVTPGSAADLGDRMITAPVALNPTLDGEAIRVLA